MAMELIVRCPIHDVPCIWIDVFPVLSKRSGRIKKWLDRWYCEACKRSYFTNVKVRLDIEEE